MNCLLSRLALVLALSLSWSTAVAAGPPAAANQSPVANALPLVVVHKSPTCGCCMNWVAHLQQAGFDVQVHNAADMGAVKARLGVPNDLRSCHTAEVAGYFVEGHVPPADIKRLLLERPDARGLAVPGMPMGSPGMEHPAGHVEPYDVLLVRANGHSVHASHGHAPAN